MYQPKSVTRNAGQQVVAVGEGKRVLSEVWRLVDEVQEFRERLEEVRAGRHDGV